MSYGVMVAQQILVLFVQVRVLVRQQNHPITACITGGYFFIKILMIIIQSKVAQCLLHFGEKQKHLIVL